MGGILLVESALDIASYKGYDARTYVKICFLQSKTGHCPSTVVSFGRYKTC